VRYLELRNRIARTIGDPDKVVFSDTTLKDMVSAAWAEISRIAPYQFLEELSPSPGQSRYPLLRSLFEQSIPEVEVTRVEIWDNSQVPARAWRFVEPRSAHPAGLSYSQAGWFVWNGDLYLPDRVVRIIKPGTHTIRVWGYCPWPPLVYDTDLPMFGKELEEAIVLYARIEALRRLVGNRELFTQWQTRSNNTDVSVASLVNDLALAQNDWRRTARALYVPREAP